MKQIPVAPMKTISVRKLGGWLPLLVLASMLVGCSSTPRAWNIKIKKSPAIEVDLVGVKEREKPQLEAYSIDKYWSPDDLVRKDADKLCSEVGTNEVWVVSRKDPKWNTWLNRGVSGLYIIANLPGSFEGSPDPRREYLPLTKSHWDAKKRTLEVEIQSSRIVILTPEKP